LGAAFSLNFPTLRTTLWNLGFLANPAIFASPAMGDYAGTPHFPKGDAFWMHRPNFSLTGGCLALLVLSFGRRT
jgi:hypothetical protein